MSRLVAVVIDTLALVTLALADDVRLRAIEWKIGTR
jgi:hypothetical protein